MLVGAHLPCHGTGGDPDTLREYAQALEPGGYDFLEAPDHVDRGSQLSRFSGRHSVSRNECGGARYEGMGCIVIGSGRMAVMMIDWRHDVPGDPKRECSGYRCTYDGK
jgi:hypothetical protein